MASTIAITTPAPRSPNAEELNELASWLCCQGHDQETADELAKCACVAVYDRYIAGSPGYVGKLMTVVWDGGPSFFDVFIWENGMIMQSERE